MRRVTRVGRTKKHLRQAVSFAERLLGIHAPLGHGEIVLILSYPRSGTTMLGTAFESLGPPIHYYGELIGLTSITPDLGVVLRRQPIFGLRLLRALLRQRRAWRPYGMEAEGLDIRTLLDALASTSGLHVAKVFWNHLSHDALVRALETYRPTVIFLRRNHYDRLVSHLRARQNDAWHGRPYVNDKVTVSEELLQSYAEDYTSWYQSTRMVCDELGLVVFDEAFEELVTEGALRELIVKVCGDRLREARMQAPAPATERQATTTMSTDEELRLRGRYIFPGIDRP